jgi:hypothetical protein
VFGEKLFHRESEIGQMIQLCIDRVLSHFHSQTLTACALTAQRR